MCICSYAPTAVPMSPKARPSASAASAPIQIADHLTGQFTTSHVSRTLSSGMSRSSSYRSTHVPCHSRCLPAMAPELREDLGRVELHEARLIGPYLVNTDVVVSGIGILLDGFEVPLGIRPAHHVLADFVFGHELGHRFKVGGQRQLPRKRGFHGRGGPALPRGLPGLGFVLSPANRELAIARLPSAAGLPGRRGRGLRDDGWMYAHRRAGHGCPELEPPRRVRDRPDHAPDEGALALSVGPGVKVVRDERERKAVLLA